MESQIKVIFFDIGNTLVSDAAWLPGARAALEEIKAAGIRIGLISNTGELNREELAARLPEDFLFEDFEHGLVLLSSEIAMEKPSLGVFLYAIQHAGVSPWQTMFVGESLEETLAAQSAGMRSVRICDAENDYPVLTGLITA